MKFLLSDLQVIYIMTIINVIYIWVLRFLKSNTAKASQIREIFNEAGISISEWARQNGFSGSLVYQVLDGKRQCLRGQSHQIAVALGIKQGCIASISDINTNLRAGSSSGLFEKKGSEVTRK